MSSHQPYKLHTCNIFCKLLECIQDCQKRYGGKTELATEVDPCVVNLCDALEAFFLHGLKAKPLDTPVNQGIVSAKKVAHIVDIFANSFTLNNEKLSFWPFIKQHLTYHDQERYNSLKHIWTDAGRGKSWIRSTLNEHSLERYIYIILANKLLLQTYYEKWALLCNDESNNLLPNMAAGLGAILFAIGIDKPELNTFLLSPSVKPKHSEPIIIAPIMEGKAKERAKRRVNNIIFDDGHSFESDVASSVGSEINYLLDETHVSDMSSSSSNSAVHVSDTSNKCTSNHSILKTLESNVGQLMPMEIEHRDGCDEDKGFDVGNAFTDVSTFMNLIESQYHNKSAKLRGQVKLLLKENVCLQQQIKKYRIALDDLNDSQGTSKDAQPDYKLRATMFEKKLAQVTEMHAELIDFNVVLQQSLHHKELLIDELKNELTMLRGPMDQLNDNHVIVWIPSAFLRGSGSEAHHVYQVFLRAGTDEWNIYRRYAQFHTLHSDLKKLDGVVRLFDFPPKKSIGNKDITLVEERRVRLQKYLQDVIRHWPELSKCTSRVMLEQHLHFFREHKNYTDRGPFSSRRIAHQTSTTETHYTGL